MKPKFRITFEYDTYIISKKILLWWKIVSRVSTFIDCMLYFDTFKKKRIEYFKRYNDTGEFICYDVTIII